jgi:hypothetical protein
LGDSSTTKDPLGASGSIPFYLCLPPVRALQVVIIIFPLPMGTFWRKHAIKTYQKAGNLLYRCTCLAVINTEPARMVNHPRELVSLQTYGYR